MQRKDADIETDICRIEEVIELTESELYGVIDVLQQYGRPINVVDINGELVVQKKFQKRRKKDKRPRKRKRKCKKI